MGGKRNGRQRKAGAVATRRLADELQELVATHITRCTQDAVQLLKQRGYLSGADCDLLKASAAPDFETDNTCEAIPDNLKGALAAANQPGAPAMSETEARSRVASNRLRAALKRRRLNQADLARLMNKSPAVVSRVLQNPEKCRIATLRKLADTLGVDLADILASGT